MPFSKSKSKSLKKPKTKISTKTRKRFPKYIVKEASRGTPSIGIGKGLFAKANISNGECVIGMNKKKIKKYTEREWESYRIAKGIPHDGSIFVENGKPGKRVTDWKSRIMPIWYRINHSPNPTLELKYEKGRVVWRATRDISIDEELTFDYGENVDGWI